MYNACKVGTVSKLFQCIVCELRREFALQCFHFLCILTLTAQYNFNIYERHACLIYVKEAV